jgi:predicted NACHT family NTPase
VDAAMPEAIVIAGANGAGKTTFAREFLQTLYPDVEDANWSRDSRTRSGAEIVLPSRPAVVDDVREANPLLENVGLSCLSPLHRTAL